MQFSKQNLNNIDKYIWKILSKNNLKSDSAYIILLLENLFKLNSNKIKNLLYKTYLFIFISILKIFSKIRIRIKNTYRYKSSF